MSTNGKKKSHSDDNSNESYHFLSIYSIQAPGQANYIVSHLSIKWLLWGRNYCLHLLMEEAKRLSNLPYIPDVTSGRARFKIQSSGEPRLLTSRSVVPGVKSTCRTYTVWTGSLCVIISIFRPPGSTHGLCDLLNIPKIWPLSSWMCLC